MLSFNKSANVLWIKKQIYHIIPGGSKAATSSVLISSNKLEIPSLNPFDFSVVGVEEVVTSGFSIEEGLNPGGKKALISSNFNEFNNEGFDDEEEGSLSVVSVVIFVKPNLLVVDSWAVVFDWNNK